MAHDKHLAAFPDNDLHKLQLEGSDVTRRTCVFRRNSSVPVYFLRKRCDSDQCHSGSGHHSERSDTIIKEGAKTFRSIYWGEKKVRSASVLAILKSRRVITGIKSAQFALSDRKPTGPPGSPPLHFLVSRTWKVSMVSSGSGRKGQRSPQIAQGVVCWERERER